MSDESSDDGGLFPATGMPDRDWWTALWPDPTDVLRALGIEDGMAVVDLCCGDGWFTAPLAALAGGRVYALDLDPVMLEKARAEVERTGVTVHRWIRGDARDLPALLPEAADFVLIANTFHGVPDKRALCRAVAAVLRPGGRFAIVNWYPLPREQTAVLGTPRGPKTEMRMSPEQVAAVVEAARFKLDRIVALPPYHYGAIFRTDNQDNQMEEKMSEQDEKAKGKDKDGCCGPKGRGMGMAREMMEQMGEGGASPMEMMHKMMAQMGEGEEGGPSMPPMMKVCMGMCSEMLTAIKRTTDMAAFATPELHGLFAEWLGTLEDEALSQIKDKGETDPAGLAEALNIGKQSAAYLVAHMARSGKLSLKVTAGTGSEKS